MRLSLPPPPQACVRAPLLHAAARDGAVSDAPRRRHRHVQQAVAALGQAHQRHRRRLGAAGDAQDLSSGWADQGRAGGEACRLNGQPTVGSSGGGRCRRRRHARSAGQQLTSLCFVGVIDNVKPHGVMQNRQTELPEERPCDGRSPPQLAPALAILLLRTAFNCNAPNITPIGYPKCAATASPPPPPPAPAACS